MLDVGKQLEDDLSWREAELASLKLLVLDAPSGSARQSGLLRALWAMLYAHYEGFFKFAWDSYLDSLEQLSIPREQAIDELARFSLAKHFRELRGNQSASSFWECFTQSFNVWMKQSLRFDVRLETRSNLWPDLVKENCREIGLPHTQVDAGNVQLRTLVSRRNEIAHGKAMIIKSIAEYQPYEEAARLAMHELAVAVLESLEQKYYQK